MDRLGSLSSRITFQEQNSIPDGAGGVLDIVWVDVCTVWASKNERIEKEQIAGGTRDVLKTTFLIQYNNRVNQEQRVRYSNSDYRIVGFRMIDDDTYIEIKCEAWV